jgi:hypothetical protein
MRSKTLSIGILFILLLSGCSLPSAGRTDNRAACLQGDWEMSNSDLNVMFATLVPFPVIEIPAGTLQMTFSGSDFSYLGDGLILHTEIPGGYMETEAVFLTTGTFTAADGMISFENLITDSEEFIWRASIDGEVSEVEGTNSLYFPPPGNGPYLCSETTLTIPAVSGTGEVFAMLFTRLP